MIKLSTPFNPGDDFSDGPYTHAEKTTVTERADGVVVLEYVLGTSDDGEFVPSTYPGKRAVLKGDAATSFRIHDVVSAKTCAEAMLSAADAALAAVLGAS